MEPLPAPGLYLEPPAFDITLEEFEMLPIRRLEAVRLIREGQVGRSSGCGRGDSNRGGRLTGLADDARLLLLRGQSREPSDAKHHRADLASHFILKLACCGGSSRNNSEERSHGQFSSTCGSNNNNEGEECREEEAERRRGRQEWFERAEKDLFEARLHWHLWQREGEAGEVNMNTRRVGRKEDTNRNGDDCVDALRVVYDLRWLQPVQPTTAHHDGVDERGSEPPERSHEIVVDSSVGKGGKARKGGSNISGKRWRDGDDPFREEEPASSLDASFIAAGAAGGVTVDTRTSSGTVTGARHSGTRDASFQPPATIKGVGGAGGGIKYTSCPFEKVLPLVRSRRVSLRDGKALLARSQVPEAVVLYFRERLRKGMAVAERGLPGVEADERVAAVLRRVRKAVDELAWNGGSGSVPGRGVRDGRDENRSNLAITRDNIDQVAAKHFPLCMRRALRILRREHHLKYQARLQLVGFLGNAGMEVGELLGLWREEFPKGIPADEYARKRNQYEYSLRHLYGLEGKRKAYSSQSCARIASSGWGGSGEGGYGHGCPFHAHPAVPGGGDADGGAGSGGCASDTSVRGMLAGQGLPAVDIEDIVRPLETGGHGGGAVGACRRHFAVSHRRASADGGRLRRTGGSGLAAASPNGWLAASTRSNEHPQPSLPPQQQQEQQEQQEPYGVVAGQGEFLMQQDQGETCSR